MHFSTAIVAAILSCTVSAIPTNSYEKRFDSFNPERGVNRGNGNGLSGSTNNHYNDYIDLQFFTEKKVKSTSVTARLDGSFSEFDTKTTLIQATSISGTEIIGHNICYITQETKVVEQFVVTKSGWFKDFDFKKFDKETLRIHCEWIN